MRTITVHGVDVPALGFGTWQLDGAACERGVAAALDIGYRHLDTAQMYGNEDHVGAALAAHAVDRGDVFVTTKLANDNHTRDRVRSSTHDSLRRLRTDYLDLLLIHWPVGETPFEETLAAMLELSEEGTVRHVGVSNFTAEQLERALETAPVFANQVEYHPFLGQRELVEVAVKHDVLVTAYSPLARGEVFDDPTLGEIARAHDASPAQIALAWLIAQDHVAAIPKATSPEHIASNFAALDLELSDDELRRINGLDRDLRLVDPPFAPW
ncbi:MAG TPA: aldo/keto reductase [Euzebyales bacterium]|nr:aldo/keto reductase [Euzebyales bacterium]